MKTGILAVALIVLLLAGMLLTTPPASAAATRYLVLADPGCNVAKINQVAGCWAAVSGGAGGASIPGASDTVVMDAASAPAAQTGTVLFNSPFTGQDWFVSNVDMTGFTGTIRVQNTGGAPNAWRVSNSFVLGGTVDSDGSWTFGGNTDFRAGTLNAIVPNPFGIPGVWMQMGDTSGTGTFWPGANSFGEVIFSIGPWTVAQKLTMGAGAGLLIDSAVDFGINEIELGVASTVSVGVGGSVTMGGVTASGLFEASAASGTLSWVNILSPYPSLKWTMGETDHAAIVTLSFGSLTVGTHYNLRMDGTTVATKVAQSNTPYGGWDGFTATISGGWSNHILSLVAFTGAGCVGTCPGTQPVVVVPAMPTLLPICDSVTLSDARPQAANAILYTWDFGDGASEITTAREVTHIYPGGGNYTAIMSVQDAGGAISNYFVTVELPSEGGACRIGALVVDFAPYIIATFLLSAVAADLLFVVSRKWNSWLFMSLSAIAVVALALIMAYIIPVAVVQLWFLGSTAASGALMALLWYVGYRGTFLRVLVFYFILGMFALAAIFLA